MMPCKYNRIELHTTGKNAEQWVTFSIQKMSQLEREPSSYYCL